MKLIEAQFFPVNFVPKLIFLLKGIFKQITERILNRKKRNFNSRLAEMVSVKNPKQDFSQNKKKRNEIFA